MSVKIHFLSQSLGFCAGTSQIFEILIAYQKSVIHTEVEKNQSHQGGEWTSNIYHLPENAM